ncbi:recombinase family protein [Hyphomicrobium sulfonivorans]|uniref:recombinase family protein n=1 Tax=Hyphomicrobium sulfonivorans TaxID=121290 RepID=UPI00156FAD27|nr:recombinase family protein [Hyphomicrobium sulfonivorans]MBI1651394.1 recombinase family protein [Hyphomicrobium sulfonivorans]
MLQNLDAQPILTSASTRIDAARCAGLNVGLRSLSHLIALIARLGRRGITFRSLCEANDTQSPAGRLMFHVLGALAEFERSLIVERTTAGLAAARAQGKVLGQPSKLSAAQVAIAMRDHGARSRKSGSAIDFPGDSCGECSRNTGRASTRNARNSHVDRDLLFHMISPRLLQGIEMT